MITLVIWKCFCSCPSIVRSSGSSSWTCACYIGYTTIYVLVSEVVEAMVQQVDDMSHRQLEIKFRFYYFYFFFLENPDCRIRLFEILLQIEDKEVPGLVNHVYCSKTLDYLELSCHLVRFCVGTRKCKHNFAVCKSGYLEDTLRLAFNKHSSGVRWCICT